MSAVTVTTCQGCGTALPPKTWQGRDQKWCSEACRKRTCYSGTCSDCGGRTGYSGVGTAPNERCNECVSPSWSRESILLALSGWADGHGGVPPRQRDALPGHDGHGALPNESSVKKHFGSWNAALLAGGFALHNDRRPETQQAIEAAIRAGDSVVSIANRYGVTRQAIHGRCRVRGTSVREMRSGL